MKKFKFSLEKMYSYKEQMLKKEKNILASLNAIRFEIEENIQNIHTYRQQQGEIHRERQQQGMNFLELSAHDYMIKNTKLQLDGLAVELKTVQLKIDAQTKVVLAVHNEIKGLDKLHQKQKDEYNHSMQKAEEENISEIIMTAMIRNKM